ncbi:MAG: 50S ribosomal protein L25/general stress protein Ctc [Desulfobacterales bacterium C00003106]|nr:MAG: 50S ribosomal protein L25/general stress protein Ctc [Desulfobacterales bacterium C00003106]OEU57439.1 MAG: 50S ribosomal protein L25/general stress protein Ctc [Desulfobacterales bacterium C00003104]
METVGLTVSSRTTTGKGYARSLRREGRIPGILYGPNRESVLLSVYGRELQQTFQSGSGENVIFKLFIDGEENAPQMAMVKELQVTPVTQEYVHVDFYEISLDKPIEVDVPLVLTGKSIGGEQGGIVQLIRKEIEVSCLPMDIPETIQIDISDLDIGDSLHIADIAVGEKISVLADTNYTVVTVLAPIIVVEEEEEAEEVGEAGEEEKEEEAEGAAE